MKLRNSIQVIAILFLSLLFNSCEKDPEEDPKEDIKNEYTLTITANNGTVIVTVDGDTLTESSQYIIQKDKTALLRAIEEGNYQFTDWEGDLSGSENPKSIIMSKDKSVVANFGEDQDPPYEAGDKKVFTYLSNKITMIYCPGGTFLTNEDDSDSNYEDGPEVSCAPFWISETEVTNEMTVDIFTAMNGIEVNPDGGIGGGSGIFNPENDDAHNYLCEGVAKWGGEDLMYMGELLGYKYDIFFTGLFRVYDQRDNQPVKEISWFGAVLSCNWFTKKILGDSKRVYSGIDTTWLDDETIEDRTKTGFRLPTSIEWECAARWQGSDSSGDAYEWPVGSGNYWTPGSHASGSITNTSDPQATSKIAVYRYNDAIKDNPTETDVVRGDRQPNFLGVYDMSGNVQEWCWDESENGSGRLIRGGGFVSQHYYLRIGEPPYGGMPAGGMGSDLGFRLVMTAEE